MPAPLVAQLRLLVAAEDITLSRLCERVLGAYADQHVGEAVDAIVGTK